LAWLMHRALPEAHGASRHATPSRSALPALRIESISTALFQAGRRATTLMLWVAFFFTQLILLLMLNWLPSLIVGLGFSRTQASWGSVCFNVCGGLGAILLGRMHAGERRRLWVVVT